jgi:uncharacterized protein with PIN domain
MIVHKAKTDVFPICPNCSGELREIWSRELRGMLGRRYIYFCPKCLKVLGVTHRKGFFMG